jgi:hypothetical protein
MNGFDPPELRDQVDSSLRRLEKFLDVDARDLEGDFVDPASQEFDPEALDAPITADDELRLAVPMSDAASLILTYGRLPDSWTSSHTQP